MNDEEFEKALGDLINGMADDLLEILEDEVLIEKVKEEKCLEMGEMKYV